MEEQDQVISAMGMAKEHILKQAMANQTPTVANIARQCVDALDTAYLFYTSLVGHIRFMEEQVDRKLATGDVKPYNPDAESTDA